jgi:hypothetical protein
MKLRRYEYKLKIAEQLAKIGLPIIFVIFTIGFFIAGAYFMTIRS